LYKWLIKENSKPVKLSKYMYYLVKLLKYFVFLFLNFFLLSVSQDIDIEQFLKDLDIFIEIDNLTDSIVFLIVSLFVVIFTFFIKQILKPFIEIFIEHYFKYGFYFLINILSISATYIILRVYGYSRLYLLIYLIFASFIFEIFDKAEKKF